MKLILKENQIKLFMKQKKKYNKFGSPQSNKNIRIKKRKNSYIK